MSGCSSPTWPRGGPGPAAAEGAPTTGLVSRPTGETAKGGGSSSTPTMSADGRLVAFTSVAANLDPADGDAVSDVYVRDRRTGVTTLVSRAGGAGGAKGDAESGLLTGGVMLNGDGRYAGFDSMASHLHPADGDAVRDVFVRTLALPEVTGADPAARVAASAAWSA